MSEANSADKKVYLLLDSEDGNDAFVGGVPLDSRVIDAPSELPPKVQTGHLFDENADANSLFIQRWGVIVPKGDRGKALFGYIEKLVAWREQEQGGEKIKAFEVDPNMDAAAANLWVVNTLSKIDKKDRPRYLLILGDLHEVSAELQVALATRYFAGRLAFSRPEDYVAYAEKVIRYESVSPTAKQCKAIMYGVRYRSSNRALDDAEEKLVNPVLEQSSVRFEKGKIPAKFVRLSDKNPRSTKEEFLEIVRSAPNPSLLFSVSHGLGVGKDRPEAERRARQGAVSFEGQVYLTAEDAKSGAFLPGGFWFLFACYGAGTPKRSAYQHWMSKLNEHIKTTEGLPNQDEEPFIAALPKAALANPEGPLAIVGHLDLAWASSYDASAGFRDQPTRFTELTDLADRKVWRRVGPIFGDFIRDLVDVNKRLTDELDHEKANEKLSMTPVTRILLWMLRQDLGAYILLGDPAAYLPFMRRGARPESASSAAAAEIEDGTS